MERKPLSILRNWQEKLMKAVKENIELA